MQREQGTQRAYQPALLFLTPTLLGKEHLWSRVQHPASKVLIDEYLQKLGASALHHDDHER